jgi:hypothetical protein
MNATPKSDRTTFAGLLPRLACHPTDNGGRQIALAYEPDRPQRVFQFGPPRESTFQFRLPSYVSQAVEVFRVDADGTENVEHTAKHGKLEVRDRVSRVAVYVVALRAGERERIEGRRRHLIAHQNAFGFDAGGNAADLAVLRQLLQPKPL